MGINRRELLTSMVLVVLPSSGRVVAHSEKKAPKDTDDRRWDDWLESYEKEDSHLDAPAVRGSFVR